ncbi:unnamed protein product [Paramecium octaurelia]|uniref:Uncharacterized protein n=1 Tax=Paramecium octaurelia TaxID=43137 RepID=A0A8S1Y960_PAROT|nr:unnamed protein product [Paramecium octaurelia]
MKAFLLVCLIATSMMVNAIEMPQEKAVNAKSDSPSFLQVEQACAVCCNGTCCLSTANCNRGKCNNIVIPYTCVQG